MCVVPISLAWFCRMHDLTNLSRLEDYCHPYYLPCKVCAGYLAIEGGKCYWQPECSVCHPTTSLRCAKANAHQCFL
jgi:hypothetical protein